MFRSPRHPGPVKEACQVCDLGTVASHELHRPRPPLYQALSSEREVWPEASVLLTSHPNQVANCRPEGAGKHREGRKITATADGVRIARP